MADCLLSNTFEINRLISHVTSQHSVRMNSAHHFSLSLVYQVNRGRNAPAPCSGLCPSPAPRTSVYKHGPPSHYTLDLAVSLCDSTTILAPPLSTATQSAHPIQALILHHGSQDCNRLCEYCTFGPTTSVPLHLMSYSLFGRIRRDSALYHRLIFGLKVFDVWPYPQTGRSRKSRY